MANSSTATAVQNIWQDRATQVSLGLAIVLNLLLFGLVILSNDRLATAIADSGTGSGAAADGVDRFGSPSNAFILPIIGLIAWLLGGALGIYYSVRNEVPIAYTVWSTVVLIELATWVPILALISGL